MKQVVQEYKTGRLQVLEVPMPALRPGGFLVRTSCSVVSVGTERQTIALARKGLIGKTLSRPDLARQVLQKARIEGVGEALRQARARLDRPVALGYSSAGLISEVGAGVEGLRVGDPVACSGLGFASHAEVAYVPRNMLAPVPDGLSLEEAAFAGVGAIVLHGMRTGEVELGSRVLVIGLGLLGLLAVQVLQAAGCHVFGTDLIPEKVQLARELGAESAVSAGEDVLGAVRAFTRGHGTDVVLITASATSSRPLELAAEAARERAKIVALGMVRLDAPRRTFYEKELQMVVPRSSGPGIYDAHYESKGLDYPLAYARWTHRRNLEEFLVLVRAGRVDVRRLITHRTPIEDAGRAYDALVSDRSVIGLVLTYPPARTETVAMALPRASAQPSADLIGVGVIGAGLFASGTLLPILRRLPGLRLRGIATATGLSSRIQGERFGFEYCTTEAQQVLGDNQVDAVIIATRHDLHARLVAEALQVGKAVFVEKPLAVSPEDLEIVLAAWQQAPGRLMVGYNRRFAPFAEEVRRRLQARPGAALVHCRVNVGGLPPGSWLMDPEEGGGVVVGEIGHFIDLIQFLCGSRPASVHASALPADVHVTDLAAAITLRDGSVGSLLYTTQGDKALSRERVEAFRGGIACVIDNFRTLIVAEGERTRTFRRWGVDRGHRSEVRAFFEALRRGVSMPVPFEEYVATSMATFALMKSLSTGRPVEVVQLST